MDGLNGLDYGNMMQKAMRGLMAEALSLVAEHGLPGEHYFYIAFETDHPGVDMPTWLRDEYPDAMTIVLQNWFDNLAVAPDRFSVTLSFSGQAETLVVPFDAVRTFADPSVKFGLKFDPHEPGEEDLEIDMPGDADEDTVAAAPEPVGDGAQDDARDHPATTGEVVSLDKFRKH